MLSRRGTRQSQRRTDEILIVLRRSKRFWRDYLVFGGASSSDDEGSFPRGLRERFCRRKRDGRWSPIELHFPVASGAICLRISATWWHRQLIFVADDGSTTELAFLEDAQAHPFALRWDELRALQRSWAETGVVDEAVSLLLLIGFVGFGFADRRLRPPRVRSLREALVRVARFDANEALDLARAGMPHSRPDYAWIRDAGGWSFTGSYGCHSLRNDGHHRHGFAALESAIDQLPAGAGSA